MTTKHKITQGEWTTDGLTIEVFNRGIIAKCPTVKNGGVGELFDNAQLIADAGTTANKCGLLPSELLEQRDELLNKLKDLTIRIEKNWDLICSGTQKGILTALLKESKNTIKKATL